MEQQPLLLKHSLFHFEFLELMRLLPLLPPWNHHCFQHHESESKVKCFAHDTLMTCSNQNSGQWCFCTTVYCQCSVTCLEAFFFTVDLQSKYLVEFMIQGHSPRTSCDYCLLHYQYFLCNPLFSSNL